MKLAKTDLLYFPKANVYWKRTLLYYQWAWGGTLHAYIGQLSTHSLPNTFIKINNNIFHGTCFQPSFKMLPCFFFLFLSCFFSNTNMFLRKNNILDENRLVKANAFWELYCQLYSLYFSTMVQGWEWLIFLSLLDSKFGTDFNFFQTGAPFKSLSKHHSLFQRGKGVAEICMLFSTLNNA